ncbi:MAG: hypothetical protein U5L76_01450 [Patescibacteria group bacterium]|nr:hypothetical protein [Patescibacteria group bacterium]
MMWMKRLVRKEGINSEYFEKAHNLFSKVERIDFFPLSSGLRGFIIVMNQRTALYFYQEDDHFIYDGYEVGPYEKGKVTIFDKIK